MNANCHWSYKLRRRCLRAWITLSITSKEKAGTNQINDKRNEFNDTKAVGTVINGKTQHSTFSDVKQPVFNVSIVQKRIAQSTNLSARSYNRDFCKSVIAAWT